MKRKLTEYDLLSMACQNMDIVIDDKSGLTYCALIDRLGALSINLKMGKYSTDPVRFRDAHIWVDNKLSEIINARDEFEKRQPELMFNIKDGKAIFAYE